MVDKKQERVITLENLLQLKGIEIPPDEEGADRQISHHQHFDIQQNELRKYTPYEVYHIEGENDDLPLQLLTAEEKVEELQSVVEHREQEIEDIKRQLESSIGQDKLKEKIETIVQREVETRVKQQTSKNTQNQQLQFIEKKLKLAEDKNEALKNLITSKDEELDQSIQQKNALTNLFESDLIQTTEKLIGSLRNVRTQEDLQQTQTDLINLQKLIAVSFQAMKGTINA